MKSKIAESYLDSKVEEVDNVIEFGAPKLVVRLHNAIHSVELAEQEVEEQMRQKAVEAFKSSCAYKDGCGGIGRDCHPVLCEDLKSFILKLNEI